MIAAEATLSLSHLYSDGLLPSGLGLARSILLPVLGLASSSYSQAVWVGAILLTSPATYDGKLIASPNVGEQGLPECVGNKITATPTIV